jgi:Fe-Mn family superoxide dismutase
LLFQLSELPYVLDALKPYCDEATVRLYHDIHHKVDMGELKRTEGKPADARDERDFALIKYWERELAFYGSGHLPHTFFWQNTCPGGGGTAQASLAKRITKDFGSFNIFKQHFTAAAQVVEGSGWTLLVWNPDFEELEILQTENYQNLTQWGVIPLLTVYVWENAYYLKYQNKGANWVEAWWNLVNLEDIFKRFEDSCECQLIFYSFR